MYYSIFYHPKDLTSPLHATLGALLLLELILLLMAHVQHQLLANMLQLDVFRVIGVLLEPILLLVGLLVSSQPVENMLLKPALQEP